MTQSVGPVPTRDFVNLTFLAEKDEMLDLQVIDLQGSVVIRKPFDAKIGSNDLEVNLTEMESGIYYLRLRGATSQLDYKLVKM